MLLIQQLKKFIKILQQKLNYKLWNKDLVYNINNIKDNVLRD